MHTGNKVEAASDNHFLPVIDGDSFVAYLEKDDSHKEFYMFPLAEFALIVCLVDLG